MELTKRMFMALYAGLDEIEERHRQVIPQDDIDAARAWLVQQVEPGFDTGLQEVPD